MNALSPITDFRPAYWQLEPWERKFVDGYVSDIENIADKTGQRLLAVLQAPFPYELDQRAVVLLARPMVRAAIGERIKELSELYDVSFAKTIRELTNIAYSNIINYFDIDILSGMPIPAFGKATPEQMSAVKSIEIDDKPRGGRKIKLVLHDKMAGLGYLMEYQGLRKPDNPHHRDQEASLKPLSYTKLPANVDDDAAADAYAREING